MTISTFAKFPAIGGNGQMSSSDQAHDLELAGSIDTLAISILNTDLHKLYQGEM